MNNLRSILQAQLVRHESYRAKPYRDTVGKLTIGYGRNLDDVGISEGEAIILIQRDMDIALEGAKQVFPSFNALSANRQSVLANMCFNMGVAKLAGFRKLRAAVDARQWDEAAKEMQDSLWAAQVHGRAVELANLMRGG